MKNTEQNTRQSCLAYIKANDANGYETLEGDETLEQLQEACRLISGDAEQ